MPRIRAIKPETPKDRKLARVSRDARLTFVYCWTVADDDGLFRAEPRELIGELFPHDMDVSEAILEAWLDELVENGQIRWRETRDGARIGEIPQFLRHQNIKNRSKPFLIKQLQPFSEKSQESLRRRYGGPPATLGVRSLESGVRSPESYTLSDVPSLRSGTSTSGAARRPKEPRNDQKSREDGPGAPSPELDQDPDSEPDRPQVPPARASTAPSERPGPDRVSRETAPARPDPVSDAELMGLVRQCLYVPDGREPVDWTAGRDVSIIRALRKRGGPGSDIRDAILGLQILRDTGRIEWCPPGTKVTLRALYDTKSGLTALFDEARTAYYHSLTQRPPRPHPADDRQRPAEHVGDILTRYLQDEP